MQPVVDEQFGARFAFRIQHGCKDIDEMQLIVFPAELKLSQFYGGVRYYHSCGNLTPFLDTLLRLPNLKILHVSSWTDLQTAYEKSDQTVILQKVMHPKEDVLDADESQIKAHVRAILATVPDRVLHICADAIYSGDIEKVKSWLQTTKEVVNETDR